MRCFVTFETTSSFVAFLIFSAWLFGLLIAGNRYFENFTEKIERNFVERIEDLEYFVVIDLTFNDF